MEAYQIPLRNEKGKLYNRIFLLILLIHVALFGYMAYTLPGGNTPVITGSAALLLCILLLGRNIRFFQKKENELIYFAIAELLISLTWFVAGYWGFGLLTWLISFLYLIARRPLIVRISKEQVIYPSFPPKRISWSAIDALVLKDGLLTINFKNDRLVQQFTDADFSSRQEQEINEFCRQQQQA